MRRGGEGRREEKERGGTWHPTICSRPTSDDQHRFLAIKEEKRKRKRKKRGQLREDRTKSNQKGKQRKDK